MKYQNTDNKKGRQKNIYTKDPDSAVYWPTFFVPSANDITCFPTQYEKMKYAKLILSFVVLFQDYY